MADTTGTATNAFLEHVQSEADAIIAKLATYYDGFTLTALGDISDVTLSTDYISPTPFATIKSSLDILVGNIDGIDISANIPTPPTFSGYDSPKWNETFWTNLKDGVQTFFNTNTSLVETDAMQSAMYQKDLARRQQTLRDLYSGANANTAAKGFLTPNSMTTALKLDAQQKFQFDAATASRDIYKFVIEWAKSNYQFAIDKTISAHSLDIDFNIRYMNAIADTYRTTILGILEEYKGKLEGAALKLDAAIKEYTLDISLSKTKTEEIYTKDKLAIENFLAKLKELIDVNTTQTNINLEETKARTAAATSALNGLVALSQGVSQILISNYKIN